MSTQRRLALIIASDSYNDKKLKQLKAPIVDAKRLAELLKDPSIGGGYEVTILPNKESYITKREIERFFRKAEKDDLLLLYFAGHGHKSIEDGLLYLATPDSELEYLDSTTIPAKFINSQIQRSKSSKIVLILDCCYSGAFARDMLARAEDKTLNVKDEFRESGCVVLTSGTAMQFSWEGNILKKEEQGSTVADELTSIYTNLIIKGIETGKADLDGDGVIACGELNEYIKTKMRESGQAQKPEIYLLKGDISIAHSKLIKKEPSDQKEIFGYIQEFKVLIKEAAELTFKNKFEEALKKYNDAIKINPNSSIPFSNRSSVLIQMDNFDDALNDANKALDIEPNNVNAVFNKGYILSVKGRYEDAIEWYDKVTNINFQDPNVWNQKGKCYERIGNKKKAKECFKIAKDLSRR